MTAGFPSTPKPESRRGAPPEARRDARDTEPGTPQDRPKEIGGPSGPEPTRYGDWERRGRCSDF